MATLVAGRDWVGGRERREGLKMVVADIIAVASWGATGGTVEVQEGRAAETETCWSAGGTRRGGRRVQSAQDGALFDERGGQE